MAEDNLMAKPLREKCVNKNVKSMTGNIQDLSETWDTLDTCNKRPKKYMLEVLTKIEFRQYKMTDSAAIRDLYSLLRAAIEDAHTVGT
jgi:hypothetical protein